MFVEPYISKKYSENVGEYDSKQKSTLKKT